MKTSAGKLSIILILSLLLSLTALLSTHAEALDPPHGDGLLFSTYLGGNFTDSGAAIAIDAEGYIYITGLTQSTQFPSTPSPQATEHGVDVFVAKINPADGSLAYILWINAASAFDADEGLDITVDDAGYAYVVGQTRSPDFCSFFGDVPGYDTSYNGSSDAFLLKVKSDGSGLEYCTFLGGGDWDAGTAVIVDENGNATLTGETWSTDFPTTALAYNKYNSGQRDIFVATIDPSGTELAFSSYIGGSGQEKGSALVHLGSNIIALTGWTNSTNLPMSTYSLDPSFNGAFDAYLLQLNIETGQLVYGSYLGSQGEDRGTGIDRLSNSQILLTGYVVATAEDPAPQFPTTADAHSKNLQGKSDAFLTLFNPQDSTLSYSSLHGGEGDEQGLGVSVGAGDTFAITGYTTSTNFPTTSQGYQTNRSEDPGAPDAFISQFTNSGSHLRYSSYLGGNEEDKGNGLKLVGFDQVYLTGSTRSMNFPVSENALNPENAGDYDIFVTKLALPYYELKLPFILRN
ncbi:MAG: SBBP repeat-containing protein [Candidatus Promineifilaceae bacterium]|nr:SBBP repeat-containing protein [Candidatus Promineifilaceae bacterium]